MSAAVQLVPPPKARPRYYHCIVCGRYVVAYGEHIPGAADLCESQACLIHYARRTASPVSLLCHCSQRRFPHELSVHAHLRAESYNPDNRKRWPWSLMMDLKAWRENE